MSTTSGDETFLPLFTCLFLDVPKVVAFRLIDYEVEALELPTLGITFFDPLVPEPITMGKFLVGLNSLDALEFGLTNFGL